MDKLLNRAEEWHKWKMRLEASAVSPDYSWWKVEETDIISAVCALLQKEVKILIAERVKKDAEMDAATKRLVDDIHDLLHGTS